MVATYLTSFTFCNFLMFFVPHTRIVKAIIIIIYTRSVFHLGLSKSILRKKKKKLCPGSRTKSQDPGNQYCQIASYRSRVELALCLHWCWEAKLKYLKQQRKPVGITHEISLEKWALLPMQSYLFIESEEENKKGGKDYG